MTTCSDCGEEYTGYRCYLCSPQNKEIYNKLCNLLDRREKEKEDDKKTLEEEFIPFFAGCLCCETNNLQLDLTQTSSGGGGMVSLKRCYKGTLSVAITSSNNSTLIILKEIYFAFDSIKDREEQIVISYCGIEANLRGSNTEYLFSHMCHMIEQELLAPMEPFED